MKPEKGNLLKEYDEQRWVEGTEENFTFVKKVESILR